MKSNAKMLSPVVFLLALVCFFLPFATFSCQGQRVLSVSGIQLVTGSSIQQHRCLGRLFSKEWTENPPLFLPLFV